MMSFIYTYRIPQKKRFDQTNETKFFNLVNFSIKNWLFEANVFSFDMQRKTL